MHCFKRCDWLSLKGADIKWKLNDLRHNMKSSLLHCCMFLVAIYPGEEITFISGVIASGERGEHISYKTNHKHDPCTI